MLQARLTCDADPTQSSYRSQRSWCMLQLKAMASQLQQKLAAFRNNQMKLQTKAAEEVRRKAAAAERAKLRKATEPKAKPGQCIQPHCQALSQGDVAIYDAKVVVVAPSSRW